MAEETEFKPINSQAEFDALIKDRIERAKKSAVPEDYADLQAKAARLAEIEEQNKSDLEKATERAEKAEAELGKLQAQAQIEGFKAQVSKATGVPVAVLRGNTLEEIQAHAEAIKGAMPVYPQVNEQGGGAGDGSMSKADILKITNPRERRAAILANLSQF